jgi:hypothetical protein
MVQLGIDCGCALSILIRWADRAAIAIMTNAKTKLSMFSRLFISYRRADFGGNANLIVGRIREHLALHYGTQGIFLDTEAIPVGIDFEKQIYESISLASAVVVVIGPDWSNEIIRRRGKNDYVLTEIRCALKLGVPLIPLVAEGVSMPSSGILTDEISSFLRLNAQTFGSGPAFGSNMQSLINHVASLEKTSEFRACGFRAVLSDDIPFGVKKVHIGNPSHLSFKSFFNLMSSDRDFQRFLSNLLRETGISSYILEMPPVSSSSQENPAEFAILPTPRMTGLPDREVYKEYFDTPTALSKGVVSFLSLGKDALLIVPVPVDENSDYKDLKSFFNNASPKQQDTVWGELATQVLNHIGERPIWISVAGGGIPWLHFRIDACPKYYRYAPYRNRS